MIEEDAVERVEVATPAHAAKKLILQNEPNETE
jgi:hypothetical protein